MLNSTSQGKIYYTLRIAVSMCFIGHGFFGVITKPIWCNYFAVFGIGHTTAYKLMPIVGSIDVLMGLVMLLYPIRAFALWLIAWGLITASLRPLSGEPFAELIERAGNFGAPLALLILCGCTADVKSWFKLIKVPKNESLLQSIHLKFILKAVVCLLFLGHGWLNIINKHSLVTQYHSIGFNNPIFTAHCIGCFEIAAAISVWFDTFYPLLLPLFIWKISTELLYPHYELLEFIERGGSYGAIFALWLVQHQTRSIKHQYVLHRLSRYNLTLSNVRLLL